MIPVKDAGNAPSQATTAPSKRFPLNKKGHSMRSCLFALLSVLFCTSVFAAEIRLSVAASMTDALKDLSAFYQAKNEDVRILANFSSSGALAKQIAMGAPADLFIAANPRWMDYLVEEKRIPAAIVRTLAHNALVFVGKKSLDVSGLDDIPGLQRIAIGSPGSVPAGQYAEQTLENAGLYQSVQGKLVMAKDVRQTLVYADRGEVDGAFVYRTDALLAQDVTILFEVPQHFYDAVTYPTGLTVEGIANPAAVAFLDFLATEEAAAIFRRNGFVPDR